MQSEVKLWPLVQFVGFLLLVIVFEAPQCCWYFVGLVFMHRTPRLVLYIIIVNVYKLKLLNVFVCTICTELSRTAQTVKRVNRVSQ